MHRPVEIREVWAENLDEEFRHIRSLVDEYPYVSMDTEFPGVVSGREGGAPVSPAGRYGRLKHNVDALKMIQLGLTLADSHGNLPSLGSEKLCFIWQFNFRDFDVASDSHAADSIELLRVAGIDFDRNRRLGVDAARFGELMMSSGLVLNDDVTWVTFHSAYDFGYLVKALTQRELPGGLAGYLEAIRVFFGVRVFDVKYMMRFCRGLFGGLDRVAGQLRIEREAGSSHQSGSDSLLTWRVFHRVRELYFPPSLRPGEGIERCAGFLFGLEDF